MKMTLLALAFVSAFASAEEVTVTGYGANYTTALENAKVLALEAGTSTFIIGETKAYDGKVTETIDQYNGGTIKSYKIISQTNNLLGYEVEIVADVVPKKDNRVIRKSVELPDFQEFDARVKVTDRLNNIGHAISAVVENPRWSVGRYSSTMNADVIMSFQPKWVSDVQAFSDVINEQGKVSNNAYRNTHGNIVSMLLNVNPFVAVAVHQIGQQTPIANTNEMMVCFAEYYNGSTECNNIGVNFDNIPRSPKLVIIATDKTNRDYILYQHMLDTKMYEFVQAGESKTHRTFTSFKKTYYQPALILYTKETKRMNINFDVDNNLAKNLQSIKVYLK